MTGAALLIAALAALGAAWAIGRARQAAAGAHRARCDLLALIRLLEHRFDLEGRHREANDLRATFPELFTEPLRTGAPHLRQGRRNARGA